MLGAKHADSSTYHSSTLLAGVQTGQRSKISHLVPIRRIHMSLPIVACFLPCCFSSLFTTWLREPLTTAARPHPLASARLEQILAPISCIVGPYRTLSGVVSPRFFHAFGSHCIPIFHVPGRKRRTIVLKDGYGIHFCRLPNIVKRVSRSWFGDNVRMIVLPLNRMTIYSEDPEKPCATSITPAAYP